MNIKLARNSGFCFGVKRAIQLAFQTAEEYPNAVTLGPIIHNPQMVEKLANEGITSVCSVPETESKPVIIRSHGVEKKVIQELREKKQIIIDATCPFVAKAQSYGKKLSEEGYPVIICGNPAHPEVIAIRSYIEGEVHIVSDDASIPKMTLNKVGVIAQTTLNIRTLKKIIDALIEQCNEVRVINTICSATSVRQQSTKSVANESDLMIVIGGKNSSNTKQLARISEERTETYHIETADELDVSWLENKENIGLTAGASTPDWIIVNIYNKIKKSIGDIQENITNVEDIPGN